LHGFGGAKLLDLKDQDKVAAVAIPPKKPKPWSKRGAFEVIFWGWWEPVFAGGFAKTGGKTWFFGGEVVVDRW
jgi:hypothetical protein